MARAEVEDRMRVFPIMLDDTRMDLFSDIEYRRRSAISAHDFVDEVASRLDRALTTADAHPAADC
jgi:hypothetical protein